MSDEYIIAFDKSDKDLPVLAVLKPLKRGGPTVLVKDIVGEQAEILYQALTKQGVEICLKKGEFEETKCTDIWCENCKNNHNCIEYLEEQERMNEEDDE